MPSFFCDVCDACGFLPTQTLFVDDNAKNIKGAESCGIKGYLFDGDVARLRAYFAVQQIL